MKKNADKLKEAKKIVEDLARECFPKSEIVRVEVAEDVDHDGDDILRVEVIHDSGKNYLLDTDGTFRFSRILHEKLPEIGIEAFPIPYWISIKDILEEEAELKKKERAGAKRKRARVAA